MKNNENGKEEKWGFEFDTFGGRWEGGGGELEMGSPYLVTSGSLFPPTLSTFIIN